MLKVPVRTFTTLDGLRGVAALAVALRHAPFLWPGQAPTGPLAESYLAVDFFFVLSGFVLAHAYANRLAAGLPFRSFMAVRLVRLYPLYALSLALSVLLLLIGDVPLITGPPVVLALNVLAGALFIPSPFSADLFFPFNFPAWSLSMELLANAAFGWLRARFTAAIVTAAGLLLALAASLGWFGFGRAHGLDSGANWPHLDAAITRVAYSFFAGVLTYRLWRARPARHVSPALIVGPLTLILAAAPPPELRTAFDLVAVMLAFPALIYLGASSPPGRATGLFTWLGAMSYGVYVLQQPLFDIAIVAFRRTPSPALGLASVAAVALIATALDRAYDRPLRTLILRSAASGPATPGTPDRSSAAAQPSRSACPGPTP